LINNSFEANTGWQFGKTKLPGGYTGTIAHSGLRSVRLGNNNLGAPNIPSYSSISQRVSLARPGYTTATLSFWYYPISDMEAGDTQESILLDANTGRTLKVLWRGVENNQQWIHKEINIGRYLGRNVIVYFNVFNDGGVGRAAMYVDDVSLTICGPATPSPTATPFSQNPTAAPSPTIVFATATSGPQLSPTEVTTTTTPEGALPPMAIASITPLPSPEPTPVELTAPEPPSSFLQTAIRSLWYILIFVILALILAVAFLTIRLLWGQTTNEEGETRVTHEINSDANPTQALTPSPPEHIKEDTSPPSSFSEEDP
jgi:hypothetical protein